MAENASTLAKIPAPSKKRARKQSENTGTSKKYSRANRREDIVRTCARLFSEHGYEQTTVRQIAKELDILSGSLYHHFPTKEDILHEIMRESMERYTRQSTDIASSDTDAETRMGTLIVVYLKRMSTNFELSCILYNSRAIFENNPEFAYIRQAKKDSFDAFHTIIQDGVDSGQFKPAIANPYLTIGTIFRMLHGAVEWMLSGSFVQVDTAETENSSLDVIIDYYLDFILSAIRTPDRIKEPIARTAYEKLADKILGNG